MKDYYALLGIEATATIKDIKKNYRKLVTKFHPDKNPAPDAASKFIVITEAYEVLSDKKRRAQYDLARWQSIKRQQGSEYNFTVVKAPQESLRTTRRKAQQKRALAYHKSKSGNLQWLAIFKESFIVAGRYILHALGLFLILLLLYSAVNQLSEAFEISGAVGVGICVFSLALVYFMFRIIQNGYESLILDMETYVILYQLPQRIVLISTFSALLIIIVSLLILLNIILR